MLQNVGPEDKVIKCVDCKNDFVFTKREQEFFAEKQYAEPKRCFKCRQARRQNNGK